MESAVRAVRRAAGRDRADRAGFSAHRRHCEQAVAQAESITEPLPLARRQLLLVGGRVKSHQQPLAVYQYGPLDHGRLSNHQADGLLFIQPGLQLVRELAKGRAGPVEQHLPPDLARPALQYTCIDSRRLVVMKLVLHAVGVEPGARLFHGVAVLDAVDSNHHEFQITDMPRSNITLLPERSNCLSRGKLLSERRVSINSLHAGGWFTVGSTLALGRRTSWWDSVARAASCKKVAAALSSHPLAIRRRCRKPRRTINCTRHQRGSRRIRPLPIAANTRGPSAPTSCSCVPGTSPGTNGCSKRNPIGTGIAASTGTSSRAMKTTPITTVQRRRPSTNCRGSWSSASNSGTTGRTGTCCSWKTICICVPMSWTTSSISATSTKRTSPNRRSVGSPTQR